MSSTAVRRRLSTPTLILSMLLPTAPMAATLYPEKVVMQGLANPRGMTFGPDGWLYVAEAGAGGDGPSIVSGDGQTVSFGLTGGVSRYKDGVQEKVADLPSLAPEGGFGATGAHDVAFVDDTMHVAIGLGADPALREDLAAAPGSALLGQIVTLTGGTATPFADLAGFELANNPVGEPDSNPFSLVAVDGGLVATDAGGNDVLTIDAEGAIAVKAALPEGEWQPVPTGAAAGPDGTLLVGQLTGFPFPVGGANVFSIDEAGLVDVFASGFTNLIDIAWHDGTLFALEFDSDSLLGPNATGSLFQIGADGTRTLAYGGLINPSGLAIGANGHVFVAENGVSPTDGRVIELAPVPLPASLPLLAGALVLGAALSRRRR